VPDHPRDKADTNGVGNCLHILASIKPPRGIISTN
jgi:hypothetical protein